MSSFLSPISSTTYTDENIDRGNNISAFPDVESSEPLKQEQIMKTPECCQAILATNPQSTTNDSSSNSNKRGLEAITSSSPPLGKECIPEQLTCPIESTLSPIQISKSFYSSPDGHSEHICDVTSSIEKATAPSETDTIASCQDEVQVIQPDAEVRQQEEESEEVRLRREMEESERLAWQLMQEEDLEAFRAQEQFFLQNSEGFTDEDRDYIRLIMAENAAGLVPQPQNTGPEEEDGAEDQVDGEGNEEEDGEGGDHDDEEEELSYERLLELGRVLGDVKTERWRTRASAIIEALPTIEFANVLKQIECKIVSPESTESTVNEADPAVQKGGLEEGDPNVFSFASVCSTPYSRSTSQATKSQLYREDSRCAVCIDSFVSEDVLTLLPCQHYFHTPCAQTWLQEHNSCPMCKTKITATP